VRIPSGTTDQYIYFVAVDSTDFATRETGLSSFTVYRSRDGGVAAAMTTPTINETDTTNMPGVYELLLDEDMTIGSGNDTEEMVFHVTHAGMAPVTRTIELYRPKITVGNTLDVTATGAAGIDWGNVENPSTSVDLSATAINLCDTVTTNTDMRGTDGAATALALATVDDNVDAIKTSTDAILIDTNELQGDWENGGRLDLILDAILADTDADVVLTATERNAIADAILNRDMSTGTDSGSDVVRTVRQALRMNRNKVSISGGTLTVTKEDDTTASWTASVTTTAGDPITTIDPA